MTAILGGLVIITAHRLFGLITWLPDNVLRWVGQATQNLGEREDEGRSRQIFGAVISRGESMAGRGMAGGRRTAVRPTKGGGSGENPDRKTTEDLQAGQAPATNAENRSM